MARLTKTRIDQLVKEHVERFEWDGEIAGFGVQLRASGRHSFVFVYKTPEGRTRRATIAKVGAMTPTEARAKALAWRMMVQSGGDPLGEKTERRNSLTIGDILDRYLGSAKFAGKAPSTQVIDRGRIKRHLRPLLGSIYADHLTADRVRRTFADIRDGKTAAVEKTGPRGKAVVTGGETAARDCIVLLRAILNWAIGEGLAKSNAAQGVKVGFHRRRETYIETADQYAALFATLDRMENEKRLRGPVADALRVIALTGARLSEIAALRWRWVDLERGMIRLPREAHKSGNATGKGRIITLPDPAVEIIQRQPPGIGDAYVFQAAKPGAVVELKRPWRKVRDEAGLPPNLGIHGLRHSIASHMALAGAGAPEIMHALGHRQLSTVQGYLHIADAARKELANKAARVAIDAMGKTGAKAGEVVPLPTTARR